MSPTIPDIFDTKKAYQCNATLRAAVLAMLGSLVASEFAHAADWEVTPTFRLRETLSDNVNLSQNRKESDLISQFTPGIAVSADGAKLRLRSRYSLQHSRFLKESRSNATNHNLLLDSNAELVDSLYLDARAAVSQQNISLLDQVGGDSTDTQLNAATVQAYSLSPYWRARAGSFATAEARYTLSSVSSDASNNLLSDSVGNRIDLSANSGAAFNEFGWGVRYTDETIDYKNNIDDTELRVLTGTGRYRLTSRLLVLGTLGYEKNNFVSSGEEPEGSIWNAGFSWTPNRRTRLDATAGRRFFGDTYFVNFEHRRRRTFFNLNYSQDLTTTRSQFLIPSDVDTAQFLDQLLLSRGVTDDIARESVVNAFILDRNLPPRLTNEVNFLTNQVFVQKRFRASLGIDLAKSVILFSAYNLVRDAQAAGTVSSTLTGTGDFANSSHIEQTGFGVVWNWALAARTNASASLNFSQNEFRDSDRQDDIWTVRLGVSRQLKPKVVGSVDYRYVTRDSNQSGAKYDENAIIGSINLRF